MGIKRPHKDSNNIEGAGAEEIAEAVADAVEAGTQQAVTEFQEAIEDTVEQAQPDVDEESWQETVETAQNTETEFESEVDSLAEFYQSDDASGSLETATETATIDDPAQDYTPTSDVEQPERSEFDRVEVAHASRGEEYGTSEVSLEPTRENLSGEGIRDLNRDLEAGDVVDIDSMVEQIQESDALGNGDWEEGVALALDDYNFDDPHAVLAGDETPDLPDDKLLDDTFDHLASDDAPSIDTGDLSPPERAEHEEAPPEQGMSTFEFFQKSAGQAAEREVLSQQAVEQDQSSGGEPMINADVTDPGFSQTFNRGSDPTGEQPGTDKVARFVPQNEGFRDPDRDADWSKQQVHPSPTFLHRLSEAQEPNASQSSLGDFESADTDGGWENPVDTDADPVGAARPVTASEFESVGEGAAENLRTEGYTKARDFADASKEDLVGVDGVGEKKAQEILDETKADARALTEQAATLEDEIRGDFSQDEYEQILMYGAENGVSPDTTADILQSGRVKGEIPGAPQPIDTLNPEHDRFRGYEPNRVSVERDDGERTSFSPTHSDYKSSADVKVEGRVRRLMKPNNPNSERQVMVIEDNQGNQTKLTVYKDSIRFSESEITTTGYWEDGTDPDRGIDPDLEVGLNAVISVENPQVNEYKGQWDGHTLATTPETEINIEYPGGMTSGNINRGPPARGASWEDETTDYLNGDSRGLRQLYRAQDVDYSGTSDGDRVEEEDVGLDTGTHEDADI